VTAREPAADEGALAGLWDALLECQTRMTLPVELPHLYTCSRWRHTPSVLDLGTGTGSYLSALAVRFPGKAFRGVDLNPGYVERARARAAGLANVSCEVGDLFAVRGRFPFVMARLVAQHLSDLDGFAAHVHSLLAPGGTFLSVEPHDRLRAYWPEVPSIMRLFRDYSADRKAVGHERDAGLLLPDRARGHGLAVEAEVDVVVPSTLPGHRELFLEFHRLIFAIFADDFGIAGDAAALAADLARWDATPHPFAQVGVRMTFYRRD